MSMRQYTRELYKRLEAETGLSTGFKPVGLHRGGGRRGPAGGVPPGGGVQPPRRPRRAGDHAAGDRRPVPVRRHVRPARRLLRPAGRPGQPRRRDDVARQGRPHAGRDASSRASRSTQVLTDGPARDGRVHLRGRHRVRVRRQLRRHVGAPARRAQRRGHPAAGGRALLPDHRADRRGRSRRGRCSRTRPVTATTARRAAASWSASSSRSARPGTSTASRRTSPSARSRPTGTAWAPTSSGRCSACRSPWRPASARSSAGPSRSRPTSRPSSARRPASTTTSWPPA